MHLVVTGLNHRTAPVKIREKLSFDEENLREALESLKACNRISECVILSTCNRTEVYACTASKADDETIVGWMGEFCGVSPDAFRSYLESHAGHKAAEHLFRVAAGIDSMVLGEAQILGQVKEAYSAASIAATTDTVLNILFQQAIALGKRVRTETEIGRGAFSVGAVAVQLAQSIFGDLSGRTVLVIGAGKMAELALTHLVSSGADAPIVTNRTLERAEDLAKRFCGRAMPFDELPAALQTADIAIASTGAREPIITKEMAASAMRTRRGRPIFLVDIAVPRDVGPEVAQLDNVFVYDIDDLQWAVEADVKARRAEVAKVEALVAAEVSAFTEKLRSLDAAPVIAALREKFEGVRLQEIEKLKAKLGHISEKDMDLIDATTRSIVNKICHTPMVHIRESLANEKPSAKLDTICELFGICPVEGNAGEPEHE